MCVCVCVCVCIFLVLSLLVFSLNIQFEALLEIHLMIICRTFKLGLEVTVEIPSNLIVFLSFFLFFDGLLSCALVQTLGLAHGALNVQGPDILPIFLEQ